MLHCRFILRKILVYRFIADTFKRDSSFNASSPLLFKVTLPTSALKGYPAAGQGDHLDRVHSDQMVLEMIRRGRLVR
jgi:hypothetical protein